MTENNHFKFKDGKPIGAVIYNKKMTDNIHKTCENYVESKDYCLKFFEENVSENYPTCKEYTEFSDKKLSRKWSN